MMKLGDFLTAKKFADQVLVRTNSVEAQYVRSTGVYFYKFL